KKHDTNEEKNSPEWATPMMKSHEEKSTTKLKYSVKKRKQKLCDEAIDERTALTVKRHDTNEEENLPE
ncbi:42592_t:CDS:1, partial [Gigaspora margarita]